MSRVRIGIFLGLSAALALPACAQYPGRIATNEPSGTTHLRATAVLEYTGDLNDLKANRLVPIVVWDGTQYQPGGLYLAQPAPLAVLTGTQYELESDGRSQGFFNVSTAENLGGHWFGVGKFQPPAAPKPLVAKSHSGHAYQIKENQEDPDKPHFAHRPPPEPGTDTQADTAQPASGEPHQSDHAGPTLHPRTHSGSDTTSGEPEADPDRPTFHRRATASTSTMEVDPNRPHLGYTTPETQEKIDTADALSGMPPDMKQIAAVSDNTTADTQSFVFSWANPDDAHKMEDALEKAAVQAIGPIKPAQNEPATAQSPSSGQESPSPTQARPSLDAGRPSLEAGKPSAHPVPQKPTKTAAKRTTHKKPAAPALPVLEDVQFRVFSLSFGGGATMVLSAYAAGDPGKYVTVIAQPDFYGNPQILLKQVASADNLDVTPRMKLIDAVDTQGNHRGDLIFELRGQTYRQFAVYRIAGGQASQVFLTQPTPTS
jgi:hypothetical protein